MANRAVDAVMGGRTVVHEHRDAPTEGGQEMMQSSTSSSSRSSQFCQFETEQFQNCMRDYNNDVSACGNFYDMLKSCQRQ